MTTVANQAAMVIENTELMVRAPGYPGRAGNPQIGRKGQRDSNEGQWFIRGRGLPDHPEIQYGFPQINAPGGRGGDYRPGSQGAIMDWRVFFTAFGTIFLAELADKTEMAVLNPDGQNQITLAGILGAMLAFGVATLIAVLFGEAIGKFVPENILRIVSAGIFILIGVLTLMGKL